MMMLINGYVHKHLIKKATSNIKTFQGLPSLSLNDVEISLRDGPFQSVKGIVNLHPSKGTLWVVYNIEKYFDSYGCGFPQNLSNSIIKRSGHCLFSGCKV